MAEQCHDRAEALNYERFPFRVLFYNSAVHGEVIARIRLCRNFLFPPRERDKG